jgi:hypothetical protein
MANWFARCELCDAFKFEPNECIAFRRTSHDGVITPAEIRDVPSSGLGCVCENCVRVLAGQLVKAPTPATTEKPDGVHVVR